MNDERKHPPEVDPEAETSAPRRVVGAEPELVDADTVQRPRSKDEGEPQLIDADTVQRPRGAAAGDPGLADADTAERAAHRPSTDDPLAALLREIARTPEVAAPPLPPGTKIGPFVVDRRVGRGGMGEVYAALDRRLDRRVALKLIRRERSTDRERRKRFLSEASIAAKIHHPRVATIFEAGESDGQLYLAMELVEGGPLSRKHRPPRAQAEDILRKVAEGLAAAHDKGVVHKDLKPENILVDAAGAVKVVDFGIASLVDDGGMSRAEFAGTLPYMSPEQLRGEPLTAASDIFTYGIVAFELLVGERPFAGESPAERLEAIARGTDVESRLAGHASPEMAKVVAACLATSPNQRPADGKALVALIASLSERQRRRRVLGIAAVPLAAALLVVGILVVKLEQAEADLPPAVASIPTVSDDRFIQARFRSAVESFYAADPEAAVRILVEVLAAAPQDPYALLLLALSGGAAEAGMTERALKARLAEATATLDDGEAWVRVIGRAMLKGQSQAGAKFVDLDDDELATLRGAFEEQREDTFARVLIATHYPWKDAVDEQVALLDAVLVDEKKLAVVYHRKASVLARSGRFEEAVATIRDGLAYLPEQPALKLLELDILAEEMPPEELRRRLDEAVARQPMNPMPRIMLANLQLETGDVEGWRSTTQRLVDLEALSRWGVRALLITALIAAAQGYFDDAASIIEKIDVAARRASAASELGGFGGRLAAVDLIAHRHGDALRIADLLSAVDARYLEDGDIRRFRAEAKKIRAVVAARRGALDEARALRVELAAEGGESFPTPPGKAAILAEIDFELALKERRFDDADSATAEAKGPSGEGFVDETRTLLRDALVEHARRGDTAGPRWKLVESREEECLARRLPWEQECRAWHGFAISEALRHVEDEAERESLKARLLRLMPGLASPLSDDG